MDIFENQTVLKVILGIGMLLAILSLVGFQFILFLLFLAVSAVAFFFLQKSSGSDS